MIALLLCLLVVALLAVAFHRLERRDRPADVVLLVLGVVALDIALYPHTTASALISVFHPEVGGQSARLTQLVIPVALAARLLHRGLPRRLDAASLVWLAFFSWVLVAGLAGVLQGHGSGVVMGEAVMVVHVGGALALAASVPARDYLAGRSLERFLQAVAVVAALLFVLDLAAVRVESTAVPGLPLLGFGEIAGDAATFFGALGLVGLTVGLSRDRARPLPVVLPSVVLLVSHAVSYQRAARLGLYLSLLLLVLVLLTPLARQRLRTSLPGLALLAAGAVAAVAGVVLAGALLSSEPEAPAVSSAMRTADAPSGFGVTTRQGSIDSRFYQWEEALRLAAERPLLGHGLGAQIVYYEEGDRAFVRSNITHNIGTDLLIRTGAVGTGLFAAGVGIVLAGAWSVWRRSGDHGVAALAMATATVVVGLLAKGMVESLFEKYRLAVLLGACVGVLVSTRLSLVSEGEEPTGDDAPAAAVPAPVA